MGDGLQKGEILALIAGLGVLSLPWALIYSPQFLGIGAVGLLSLLSIGTLFVGQTASFILIAAVLAVGAFLLGGLIAIHRAIEQRYPLPERPRRDPYAQD
jgi:hypothetical protein